MLMEHETSKLKELDEGYAKEFKDWKADLKPRKQVGTFKTIRETIICSPSDHCGRYQIVKCPQSSVSCFMFQVICPSKEVL